MLALLWIEKAVHKCYGQDDAGGAGDKFLSESASKGCCDHGEDYERLLACRDHEISPKLVLGCVNAQSNLTYKCVDCCH